MRDPVPRGRPQLGHQAHAAARDGRYGRQPSRDGGPRHRPAHRADCRPRGQGHHGGRQGGRRGHGALDRRQPDRVPLQRRVTQGRRGRHPPGHHGHVRPVPRTPDQQGLAAPGRRHAGAAGQRVHRPGQHALGPVGHVLRPVLRQRPPAWPWLLPASQRQPQGTAWPGGPARLRRRRDPRGAALTGHQGPRGRGPRAARPGARGLLRDVDLPRRDRARGDGAAVVPHPGRPADRRHLRRADHRQRQDHRRDGFVGGRQDPAHRRLELAQGRRLPVWLRHAGRTRAPTARGQQRLASGHGQRQDLAGWPDRHEEGHGHPAEQQLRDHPQQDLAGQGRPGRRAPGVQRL